MVYMIRKWAMSLYFSYSLSVAANRCLKGGHVKEPIIRTTGFSKRRLDSEKLSPFVSSKVKSIAIIAWAMPTFEKDAWPG